MADFSFDTPATRTVDEKRDTAKRLSSSIAQGGFALERQLGNTTEQLQELNEEAFIVSASARDVYGVYQDKANDLAEETGILLDKYREANDSVFHNLIATFSGGDTTADIARKIRGQSIKQISISNANKKAQRGYAEQADDISRRTKNISLGLQGATAKQDTRFATLSGQQQAIILQDAAFDQTADNFSLAALQEQMATSNFSEFPEGQLELQILRKIKQRSVVKQGMSKEKDPLKQAAEDTKNAEFLFGTLNLPQRLAHKDVALLDRAKGGQGVAQLQIPNLQTQHKLTLQQIERISAQKLAESAEAAGADPRFARLDEDYALAVDSLISTTDRAFEGLYDLSAKDGQIVISSVPPEFAGDFTQLNRLNIASQAELAKGNVEGSLRDRKAAATKMNEIRTAIIENNVMARDEDQQPAYREYLQQEGFVRDPTNARNAVGTFLKQPSSANLAMPTEIRTVMDTIQKEFQTFVANRTNLMPEIGTGEGGSLMLKDFTKAREQEFFDSIFSKRYIKDQETGKVISAPSDAEKGSTFGIVDMMRASYAVNYNKYIIASLSKQAPGFYEGLFDSTGRPKRAIFSNTTNLIKGLIASDAALHRNGTLPKEESLLRTFVQEAQLSSTFEDYRATQFNMSNSFPSALLNTLMFGNHGDSQLEALYLGSLSRIDFERVAGELNAETGGAIAGAITTGQQVLGEIGESIVDVGGTVIQNQLEFGSLIKDVFSGKMPARIDKVRQDKAAPVIPAIPSAPQR